MSSKSVFEYFDSTGLPVPKNLLLESSISEFASVIECGHYKDVRIDALDMSSGAKTGTFKDWVACATIAYCRHHKIEHFVTQSSGNTANALAAYCSEFGQPVTIFYMLGNSQKIKPQFFVGANLELIAVDGTESRMKELTQEFAQTKGIPWLPRLEIQDFANAVRADFVTQFCKRRGTHYDWHSQSLSSGYGVFGFYQGLQRLGHLTDYKFLGVQQSVVSPFIQRFRPEELSDIDLTYETLIEKTLFRSTPTDNLYARMEGILNSYGGSFSVVSNATYDAYEGAALDILRGGGAEVVRGSDGEIIEKSGLIDLIGVLKAIDRGTITRGSSVLVSITGGLGEGPIGELAPSQIVN